MKLAAAVLAAFFLSAGPALAGGFDPIEAVYGKPVKTRIVTIASHKFVCQYWIERWGFMSRCFPLKKSGPPA